MFVRGVVQHEVQEHPDAALVGLVEQGAEVFEGAEYGVYARIVRDIVTQVGHRGWVDRGDPERVNAQVLEVVQPPEDAPEVTDAVTV